MEVSAQDLVGVIGVGVVSVSLGNEVIGGDEVHL